MAREVVVKRRVEAAPGRAQRVEVEEVAEVVSGSPHSETVFVRLKNGDVIKRKQKDVSWPQDVEADYFNEDGELTIPGTE